MYRNIPRLSSLKSPETYIGGGHGVEGLRSDAVVVEQVLGGDRQQARGDREHRESQAIEQNFLDRV